MSIAVEDRALDAVKYCVEELKLEIKPIDISIALQVSTKTENKYKQSYSWLDNDKKEKELDENIITKTYKPLFKITEENEKELVDQNPEYNFTKNQEEICKYLLQNYKGDLTELCIDVLNGDISNQKIHHFYTLCKDLNINLPIHNESFETIALFHSIWVGKGKWFSKIKKYNISLYNYRDADSVEVSKLPSKEIVENVFLKIKPNCENKKIYELLKEINVDSNKIMYFFITTLNSNTKFALPTHFIEEHESILGVLDKLKIKIIDDYQIHGTHEGEAFSINNKKGLPLEHFKKEYEGKSYPNRNKIVTITKVDYKISEKRDVCNCKEVLEEERKRLSTSARGFHSYEQLRELEENSKNFVYYNCPVHGKHKNDIYMFYEERYMTFEEFLKYTDKVSKDKYKKKLEMEMDQLEKEQKQVLKDLEEKKKKLKSRIDNV